MTVVYNIIEIKQDFTHNTAYLKRQFGSYTSQDKKSSISIATIRDVAQKLVTLPCLMIRMKTFLKELEIYEVLIF